MPNKIKIKELRKKCTFYNDGCCEYRNPIVIKKHRCNWNAIVNCVRWNRLDWTNELTKIEIKELIEEDSRTNY